MTNLFDWLIAIAQFLSLYDRKSVANFPAHTNASSFAFKIKCCDDHLKSPLKADVSTPYGRRPITHILAFDKFAGAA